MMFDIPCVILCGGKSSRMGEDKSLLAFSSSNSLATYQYDKLKPCFKNIYLSSKENKFDFECNIILDEKENVSSPIIALYSIFKQLKNEKKIFIITVDNPLVSIQSIKKLIDNSNNYDISVAKTERIHSLCGVFSSNILEYLDYMIKNDIHKVGFLLEKFKTNIIEFSNEDEFINLNYKSDYEKAKKLISSNL